MEAVIYMPYYDYNDDAFDTDDEYYSDADYIDAVKQSYEATKDIVFESMLSHNRGDTNALIGADGQAYKFGQKTSQDEDKVAYSPCSCTLYNDEGNADDVDGIIDRFAKQKSFVETVLLDADSMEEEFNTELLVWLKEHDGINQYKALRGEEWAWRNEPKRSLKLRFKNKADEELFAVLHDCKIMDKINDGMYVLFVNNITLVDKI